MAIFEDCVFFVKLKCLSIQEKSRLKASIKENGGVVNFALNHKVSSRFISEISVGKYQVVQML